MTVDVVVELVVDVANVMGSRPDGWWRDRPGAAARLTRSLAALQGTTVTAPDGREVGVGAVHAVVEGQARGVPAVDGVLLVRAEADGDTSIARVCAELLAAGHHPLAVTADRGLRARLAIGTTIAGPRWLLDVLGRAGSADSGQDTGQFSS
jgi:hypothetical protein